jgi:hypothetical protein
MQNPTGEEGALIKREWWQDWEHDLPPIQHIIQSYDTAFMKNKLLTILLLPLGEYSHPLKIVVNV